jgi:hypothetical protein
LGDQTGKPWAIVGKGPQSFSTAKVYELKERGYSLCSINNTFDACTAVDFDLCIFNDWHVATWFKRLSCKAFATVAQAHQFTPKHYKTLPGLVECMAAMSHLPNLCAFDALGSEVFPKHPNIFTCTSSSESAFDILCKAGVRKFHFVGIDGGKGYHSAFTSPTANDLTGQFRGIAAISRRYSVEHIDGLENTIRVRFFKQANTNPRYVG